MQYSSTVRRASIIISPFPKEGAWFSVAEHCTYGTGFETKYISIYYILYYSTTD